MEFGSDYHGGRQENISESVGAILNAKDEVIVLVSCMRLLLP